MPFSDPEGYAPGHFCKVYDQIIEPAITDAGFVPVRVDENKISDQIITKIFDGIITCEMAICDLSSNNPNVLYELGLRHAYDKPVVLIHDDRTNRIFDIQGISIIQYRSSRLYDEVIDDRKKISESIKVNADSKFGYSIVNVVKMQKAKYDANIKNTDLSGIDNTLLIRVLGALDRAEEKQDYYSKQDLNTWVCDSDYYKTFFNNLNSSYKRIETVSILLSRIGYNILEITQTVNKCDEANTSFKELKRIENEITKLNSSMVSLTNSNWLTIEQKKLVSSYFTQTEEIIKKINKLKENHSD